MGPAAMVSEGAGSVDSRQIVLQSSQGEALKAQTSFAVLLPHMLPSPYHNRCWQEQLGHCSLVGTHG